MLWGSQHPAGARIPSRNDKYQGPSKTPLLSYDPLCVVGLTTPLNPEPFSIFQHLFLFLLYHTNPFVSWDSQHPAGARTPSSYSEPSLRLFSHPLILIHAPFHLLFHFPFPPPFLLSYFYFTTTAPLYQVLSPFLVPFLLPFSIPSPHSLSTPSLHLYALLPLLAPSVSVGFHALRACGPSRWSLPFLPRVPPWVG